MSTIWVESGPIWLERIIDSIGVDQHTPRLMDKRGILLFCLAGFAIALLGGCGRPTVTGPEDLSPDVLVVSGAWQQATEPATVSSRVGALEAAIGRLRDESGAPWVGRQDDQTGYLAELSGGSWVADDPRAGARALLDRYAQDLFGMPSTQVRFVAEETGQNKVTALRAEQKFARVPVVDGALVFTVRDGSLIAARGRVFPGVDVNTDPGITRQKAARQARREAGGQVQGRPELAILPPTAADPTGGTLVWQVLAAGRRSDLQGAMMYFVDAQRGGVIGTRATGAEFGAAVTRAASRRLAQVAFPQGESTEVTGTAPQGQALRGNGLRTPDGQVVLGDTTTPTYDPATGAGGIYTFEAQGADKTQLPGQLVASADGNIRDSDAAAAHVYARYVYDYFREVHGRNSWDGNGAAVISSIGYGPPNECNAYFNWGIAPAQMIYARACTRNSGPVTTTMVDVDVTAHELTHGVTSSSANLAYTGQSGALNEAFSDYFGVVIGNKYSNSDDVSLGEGLCIGIEQPTDMCTPDPGGLKSMRYMLNGATYDDYLRLLDPPAFSSRVLGWDGDNGGVHLNSAIWNNAVWSIRTQLAKIDGVSGNESRLAAEFDAVVYATLTRYLTPTSGFLDAGTALEAAGRELAVDPTVQRVISEQLQFNKICAGCSTAPLPTTTGIQTTTATQKQPSVAGDRATWLEFSGDYSILGTPAQWTNGGAPTPLPGTRTAFSGFAGPDAVVTAEVADLNTGRIVMTRHDLSSGAVDVVADSPGIDFLSFSGSDAGAAWWDNGEVKFLAPDGTLSGTGLRADLFVQGESVLSIGTGDGQVVVGGDQGSVVVWRPGSEPKSAGQRLPGPVIYGTATGDTVAAMVSELPLVSFESSVYVFGSGGAPRLLTDQAAPNGLAADGSYLVWSQYLPDNLPGAINEEFGFPDSDLFLYSVASNGTYHLLKQPGEQGFPALSGNRLVWQDAVLGGDDVFTATVPPNL